MLNNKIHWKFTLLRRRYLSIVDESNHNDAEQERFVQMEITFTLRKNGSYNIPSGFGGRSFPVDRQEDENLIV